MKIDGASVGQLFSRVYLDKGTPTQDSKRFRRRLTHFVIGNASVASYAVDEISQETGVKIWHANGRYNWEDFFEKIELRDLLDSITLLYSGMKKSYSPGETPNEFREFVRRSLREENLAYRIDDGCGVHFYADQEFEASRVSTIAGLFGTRYRGAREAFDSAQAALAGASPDTLAAVRSTFDAVENVFKLMFDVPRIGASEVNSKLKPKLAAMGDERNINASKLMASSLAEWVNAGHQYRHAPNVPDPSPPPLTLALLMISSGAGFLRWLVELDAKNPGAAAA